jgi:hypothetical protein
VTLNLAAISRQIEGMALAAPWRDGGAGLELALTLLTQTAPAQLSQRISAARTSWLVAQLTEALDTRIPRPPCPPDWSVLATDGSSINPDRHSPVHYFLINTGHVRLTYGARPGAEIGHAPRLYFKPEETHIRPPDGVRRIPIDGPRLAAFRAVTELAALADLVERQDGPPAVALQDGTLIIWSLQSEEEVVQEHLIAAYLDAADRIRRAGVPLASYISAPASKDVVNALRVAYCPHVPHELPTVHCERCPSAHRPEGPACEPLAPLTDQQLFARRLRPGERSALFASASKVIERYVRREVGHRVLFFYLHTGREVARVEIPQWVAAEPDLLDHVHAVIVDQVQRGQGYPSALQEAHEAAVIHADERRVVDSLIEAVMARAAVTLRRSAKDTSKRVRAL